MSVFPYTETWQLRKAAVQSAAGLVVSQNHVASDVGAKVLATGGNAVDAAVAASFAIGTMEPWMSGLGGGGFMQVYDAAGHKVETVDFGMVAPSQLDPGRYRVVEGTDSDLFSWPAVEDDINVKGPHSVAVPGQVAGMALALRRFGTRSWTESLRPAIDLAQQGIPVDWYATLKIAGNAPDLALFPETKKTYLPNGYPPAADWASPLPEIHLGELEVTLRRLAEAGPEDFYRGQIAERMVSELRSIGSTLTMDDLAGYEAQVVEPQSDVYRQATIHTAGGLTAGPTLLHTLALLSERFDPEHGTDARRYTEYALALRDAYEHRLGAMGDETPAPTSTTHLSVVDRDGNMVALTQTLLSVFGSRVMLTSTGMLMNNGIMWFDPRSGRPNSIGAGKRPLSNMCPVIIRTGDGSMYALGASGGRRIMPAVMQLISFLGDCGMNLDSAMHEPRIDYSGTGRVTADNRLADDTLRALGEEFPVDVVQDSVYPSYFACPNVAGRSYSAMTNLGAAFVNSPWAKVGIGEG